MKDTIPVPKAWLERLISLSQAILSTPQDMRKEGKQILMGYIESARLLIGQEDKERIRCRCGEEGPQCIVHNPPFPIYNPEDCGGNYLK